MIRLGLIGYSQLNGHPYSFGSIINGYNPTSFDPEWSSIAAYLAQKPSVENLSHLARVVSVWAPDSSRAVSIQKSCQIDRVCVSYRDMTDVDAVIIARDDWQERKPILEYFLEREIPCFCDKPLTVLAEDLDHYEPYLKRGLLYTGSGLRYSYEFDCHRQAICDSPFVSAYVVNDLAKYGIHMLDALFSMKQCNFKAGGLLADNGFPVYELLMDDESLFRLTTSPVFDKTFMFNYLTPTASLTSISVKDNFTGFRRLLLKFLEMISSGRNSDYLVTINSLRALCCLSSYLSTNG